MTPDEAVWAATAGGALALRRDDVRGAGAPGKRADLVVLDAPSHIHLAYRPGGTADPRGDAGREWQHARSWGRNVPHG